MCSCGCNYSAVVSAVNSCTVVFVYTYMNIEGMGKKWNLSECTST